MTRYLEIVQKAVDDINSGKTFRTAHYEAVAKETNLTKEVPLSAGPPEIRAEYWGGLTLSEFERRHVAIQIRSDEYGMLWLVSTQSARELADPSEPAYTVEEARQMIGLPAALVRHIHRLRKSFGGTFEITERMP